MKKMRIYIYILCAVLGLSSCGEDFLNVNPTSVATEKQEESVRPGLLTGLYAYMYKYNTYGSSSASHRDFGFMSLLHTGDVMNDDLAFYTQGSNWFTWDYQLDFRDQNYTKTSICWKFFYTLINNANNIISRIPADTKISEDKAVRGQALALRSMAYYYLLNFYQQTYLSLPDPSKAPGVPLLLTEQELANKTDEEKEKLFGRVDVKTVYDNVVNSFKQSIQLLDGYNRPSKGRINKEVAQLLLSRVYLTIGNWEGARDMAHSVRVNLPSIFKLMTLSEVSADGYNDINNKEWLWGADITNETSTAFGSFFAFVGSYDAGYAGKSGQYRMIDANLYSQFSKTDKRREMFKDPSSVVNPKSDIIEETFPPYTNLKFKRTANWTGDYVYMRLSEAYLTEAEALAHLGKNAEAATVLNELMKNRDPQWNKNSVTVDEVYQQRRFELWGEGFSLFDHLRLKKDVVRDYEGSNHWSGGRFNVKAGDWVFIYQLPLVEMQENKALTPGDQNP